MRVKVGNTYIYQPVGADRYDPPHGEEIGLLAAGDHVKVVNLPGCPKANTMGHCHITKDGKFAGLVLTNSLVERYDDDEDEPELDAEQEYIARMDAYVDRQLDDRKERD